MRYRTVTILLIIALICGTLTFINPSSTVKASPATIHVPADYTTISSAIAHANLGDTIIVASGTYHEEVVIGKSLSIIGGGAGSTFIDGTGVTLDSAGLVKITAPGDVTFSGFTVQHASVAGDGVTIGILSQSGVAGVTYTISYDNIYGSNDVNNAQDYGFYSQDDSANVVFTHNYVTQTGCDNIVFELHTGTTEISYDTLDAGVYGIDAIFMMTYNGYNVNNLQNVSYNIFNMGTGEAFDYDHRATAISFNTPGAAYGPTLTDAQFTNVLIQGNTINNLKSYGRGIGFWNGGGGGGGIIDPVVEDNTITGVASSTESYGIDFIATGSSAIAALDATVVNNVISKTDYGIYLRTDGCAPGAQIHFNNIAGNTVGLDNTVGSSAVDARFNWWGDATGPGPTGKGDLVTGNADASHYLHSPFAAQLYASPTLVSKAYSDIGADFTINVKIQKVEDFFGFDINVTWDNSLITFKGCSYNATLDTLWPSGWFLEQNTTGVNGGTGWYRLVGVSTSSGFTTTSSQTLFPLTFHIEKGSNVQQLQTPIHFATVQLSNSLYTSIPAEVDDGLYQISPTTPGLEFQLIDSNPFEYGKTFEVQVNVTDVCSQLTGYSFTIIYDTELFSLTGVNWVGSVLGGSYTESPHGTVNVMETGGSPWIGNNGLLFTLSFQIQFDDSATHIWRTNTPHDLTRNISFQNAQLTFTDGTLLMSGIQVPSPLSITVHLIQGDVNCDGKVDVFDLRAVAAYYDQSAPTKYDLNNDGTIDIFDLVVVAANFGHGGP